MGLMPSRKKPQVHKASVWKFPSLVLYFLFFSCLFFAPLPLSECVEQASVCFSLSAKLLPILLNLLAVNLFHSIPHSNL